MNDTLLIAVVMILVIGVSVSGALHLWRDGKKTAVLVSLGVIITIALFLFLVGQSAKCCGMVPGLEWVIASFALLAGPGLGVLIGVLVGLILRPYPKEPTQ